jgi:hypothetical protein
MPKQPGDALTAILGEMADRAEKYAKIWQHAAAENADKNYSSDDAIADLQKTYTFAVRDMAELGAAWIEAFASVVTVPAPAKKKAPAKKAAAKKKAPAKKAAAKKAAAK